jgi:Xaa-Pro aminopeptidase
MSGIFSVGSMTIYFCSTNSHTSDKKNILNILFTDVFLQVTEGRAVFAVSPVLLMKDRKSDIEAQGMQNAHIRDAVALCHFLYMLEEGVSFMKIFSKKTK